MKTSYLQVLNAAALVGTLDMLAACINYYLSQGSTRFDRILKYIASGFFGEQAFSGGPIMAIAGLSFHYLFALLFTVIFYLAFRYLKDVQISKILVAILYGIFVWAVMNLLVIPLSKIEARPFALVDGLISIMILIVCIGLPLTLMSRKFYK